MRRATEKLASEHTAPKRTSERTASKRASERIKSQGKGKWTLKERKLPSYCQFGLLSHIHTAARRSSYRTRSQGELKRNSDHLARPDFTNKRSKKDNGAKSDAQTLDAMIQNGLYVAEMFAAHVARPYVVSYIVVGKSVLCCFGLLIQLIIFFRRHDLHVAFQS